MKVNIIGQIGLEVKSNLYISSEANDVCDFKENWYRYARLCFYG